MKKQFNKSFYWQLYCLFFLSRFGSIATILKGNNQMLQKTTIFKSEPTDVVVLTHAQLRVPNITDSVALDMSDKRILKVLLYGEVATSKKVWGWPHLHFKGTCKRDMMVMDIIIERWEDIVCTGDQFTSRIGTRRG